MLSTGFISYCFSRAIGEENEPYWVKFSIGLVSLLSFPTMIIGALIAIWS